MPARLYSCSWESCKHYELILSIRPNIGIFLSSPLHLSRIIKLITVAIFAGSAMHLSMYEQTRRSENLAAHNTFHLRLGHANLPDYFLVYIYRISSDALCVQYILPTECIDGQLISHSSESCAYVIAILSRLKICIHIHRPK